MRTSISRVKQVRQTVDKLMMAVAFFPVFLATSLGSFLLRLRILVCL